MTPVAMGSVPPVDRISSPSSKQSIEEVCFSAALICLEGHYTDSPPMPGTRTQTKVVNMVARTLEKTHTLKDVREALSRSVEIWIYLTKIFAAAVPSLTSRSVGPLSNLNDPDKGVTSQESTALILDNYQSLKDDLQMLNKLMHIARNLLVTSEPEVPQDLCAAVSFDQMVYQAIILCVNVTSKGYDGDGLDDGCRNKLNEINELYKKLLVTSLQQLHNWTAKNDRNKMSFWYDVLFDEDPAVDDPEGIADGSALRTDVAKTEVQHWIERNSIVCDKAMDLLAEYAHTHTNKAPGIPAAISPLAGTWIPGIKARTDSPTDGGEAEPRWASDEQDKFEQDKGWGRVSREVDTWWEKARDQNFESGNIPMPSKEYARARHESFLGNIEHRYGTVYHREEDDVVDENHDDGPVELFRKENDNGSRSLVQDYVDDMIDDEDLDDNESYGEGPMTGLLTEIPNILDPKQIEALHMVVKSCVLDSMGVGRTRYGESLQKTRCRMLLALDCGKSLLREILVFIAVWEQDEQSLIFEITSQIVEALHDVALLPYAWHSLRIPKDVISPAQAVLLRMINHMFCKQYINPPDPVPVDEDGFDLRLVQYLLTCVRIRIVPECLALMRLQGEIRREVADPIDFPVDTWDMERARDGLAQVLDFLATISEIDDMRSKLVEWEVTFELITLLKGLEDGVPRKQLVDAPKRPDKMPPESPTPELQGEYQLEGSQPDYPPPPPPPPSQEPAHKFPWAGIKIQILTILANLLQPEKGKSSPGNPTVQTQIMQEKGIVPLLNCCAYDDHNRFARERVQLCLKYLIDGSQEANKFLRDLVRATPAPSARPDQQSAPGDAASSTTSLRIDGIEGEVKVQWRPAPAQTKTTARRSGSTGAAAAASPANTPLNSAPPQVHGPAPPPKNTRDATEELYGDIMSLAGEAARLAIAEDVDQAESDESFMMFLKSERFREHFKDKLVERATSAGSSVDESCAELERALLFMKDTLVNELEFQRKVPKLLSVLDAKRKR